MMSSCAIDRDEGYRRYLILRSMQYHFYRSPEITISIPVRARRSVAPSGAHTVAFSFVYVVL